MNDEQGTELVHVEPMPLAPGIDISKLPRDLAVVRMEHEQIASLAIAHPRDPVKMVEMLKSRVRAYKTFAESAIYNKPVGRDGGVMKYARGLSIRAAEAINSVYGYTSISRNVERIDDMNARISVTWMDYQQGSRSSSSRVVSRRYTQKGGGVGMHNEDRFLNVVIPAEMSKLVRDTILHSVDPGLKLELMATVEEEQSKFLDDNTVSKLISAFAAWKVTPEQIESYMGKRVRDFRLEDRKTLQGLYTAIKDEEISVAEAFGGEQTLEPTGKPVPPGYFEALKVGNKEQAQKLIGGPGYTVETINGIRQVCKIVTNAPPANGAKPPDEDLPAAPEKKTAKPKTAVPSPTPNDVPFLQRAVWDAARAALPSVAGRICKDCGVDVDNIEATADPEKLQACIDALAAANSETK